MNLNECICVCCVGIDLQAPAGSFDMCDENALIDQMTIDRDVYKLIWMIDTMHHFLSYLITIDLEL